MLRRGKVDSVGAHESDENRSRIITEGQFTLGGARGRGGEGRQGGVPPLPLQLKEPDHFGKSPGFVRFIRFA